ncbi:MAG: 3-keto-5-aminohexanoate cleavage protein [Afipia sp.]|jgi:uncharacterized protein (DUF849 family)|nr:3-keto-5-aminohexanoate cleavage protein [Afipia sp.]
MTDKVIITCAITGGHGNFAKVPDFPITPEQIARDCLRARAAGAAIVHIHVRNPQTGQHSGDLELFREVVKRVRDSGSDVLINLTTGWGGRYVPGADNPQIGGPGTNLANPERRLLHIVDLRPSICTLDVGTVNFGEQIFVGFPPHIREMAAKIRDIGVTPELECFELGHIAQARALIDSGLVIGTPLFQLCLGIPNAAPATPETLMAMRAMLPPNANWAAFAIGRQCFDFAALSTLLGGHVRVGLEDNLYMSPGEFATNEKLVAKAADIVETLGRSVATPAEAARIIGLREPVIA